MSKTIEERAVRVVIDVCNNSREDGEPFSCKRKHDKEVAALSRAGLLVSERDELCREIAGSALWALRHGFSNNFPPSLSAFTNRLAAYDREHAPKPRYVVVPLNSLSSSARTTHAINDKLRDGLTRMMGTEAECNAVAAALNALAEKEAGR